jgi:hypothetical protein
MTAETTFDATSDTLANLLNEVAAGRLQLPDFQRGWVWDDDHIASVLTSVSRSFPIGAVMTLQTGGEVRFKARVVEGVTFKGEPPDPDRLLLDGQQRLTSMYQALKLKDAIRTRDTKRRVVEVFYYVDVNKALGSAEEREEAVFSVPVAKRLTADFGRQTLLDLTTPEREYQVMMFPLNQTFSCEDWFDEFRDFWESDKLKKDLLKPFRKEFIDTFKSYALPVIQLRRSASKEAVCRVFEKVNTGGVPLTAFELLTATYAADGYNLRLDWLGDAKANSALQGRKQRMAECGKVLEVIEATDFLQAASLLYTMAGKKKTEAGQGGKGIPSAISCTRQSILDLPATANKPTEPRKVSDAAANSCGGRWSSVATTCRIALSWCRLLPFWSVSVTDGMMPQFARGCGTGSGAVSLANSTVVPSKAVSPATCLKWLHGLWAGM